MIPSRDECLDLLEEHNVPENIRRHSFKVNTVALFLARKLKEKGIQVDVKLVDRASLLHDLDKVATLDNMSNHGRITAEILDKKGIDKALQRIILNHHFNADWPDWETKIVNYADKRVRHDKIVTLKERFEYGRKKYPDKHDIRGEKRFFELEKEMFDIIGMNPDDLVKVVI